MQRGLVRAPQRLEFEEEKKKIKKKGEGLFCSKSKTADCPGKIEGKLEIYHPRG